MELGIPALEITRDGAIGEQLHEVAPGQYHVEDIVAVGLLDNLEAPLGPWVASPSSFYGLHRFAAATPLISILFIIGISASVLGSLLEDQGHIRAYSARSPVNKSYTAMAHRPTAVEVTPSFAGLIGYFKQVLRKPAPAGGGEVGAGAAEQPPQLVGQPNSQ